MPIHDWTRVDANLFHDFHQTWTVAIRNALNGGILPRGYAALVEQHAAGLVPDVLALQLRSRGEAALSSFAIYSTLRPKTDRPRRRETKKPRRHARGAAAGPEQRRGQIDDENKLALYIRSYQDSSVCPEF
jgi:hypothetical protein